MWLQGPDCRHISKKMQLHILILTLDTNSFNLNFLFTTFWSNSKGIRLDENVYNLTLSPHFFRNILKYEIEEIVIVAILKVPVATVGSSINTFSISKTVNT